MEKRKEKADLGEIEKLKIQIVDLKIEIGGLMGERDGKQLRIEVLEMENKKLKEEIKERQEEVERFKQNAMADMKEITDLEIENKKLRKNGEYYNRDNCQLRDEIMKCKEANGELSDYIEELEDELWVRKHSVSKLRKDKELYEKAREVMFGKEEEDLYEDIPTIRIDKDGNVVDENGDRTYNSGVFHYAN